MSLNNYGHIPGTNASEDVLHPCSSQSKDTESTGSLHQSHGERPPLLHRLWDKIMKIVSLLAIGYATEASRNRYKVKEDWPNFQETITTKLENIGIVSGLLISSTSTMLCSGELRRMTFITTMMSMLASLLSIVFGLLCLWGIVGVHPIRLKSFVENRGFLFWYLYATPSLFGGVAALSFFVAVGSWAWLDLGLSEYGIGGRVLSIVCSAALVINAAICFILGGSTW